MSVIEGRYAFDFTDDAGAGYEDASIRWRSRSRNQYDRRGMQMSVSSPDTSSKFFAIHGPLACCWDGRLDNAAELASELGIPKYERDSPAAVAVRLFARRGCSGLGKLIGDWSAAICDASSRNLVLARDYAGVRPLYYAITPGRVAWSSSLEDLAGSVPTELSEEYLVEFALRGSARTRTPYRNIFRVLPGHAVVVSGHGIESNAIWAAPIEPDIRFKDPADYGERLNSLFRSAVRARLSPAGNTVAELSGGLDSSSVVCAAAETCAESKSGQTLGTLSYDEERSVDKEYIAVVERHCAVSSMHMSLRDHSFVEGALVGNAEPFWWHPRLNSVAGHMQSSHSGTLLTGRMGDLIMGNYLNDVEQVADDLVERHYGKVIRGAIQWSRALKKPIYSVISQARSCATGTMSTFHEPASYEDSLAPGAQDHLQSVRGDDMPLDWKHLLPSRRKKLWMVRESIGAQSLQCPEPLESLSVSHPFADRRLVEFMLRIPASVVCGPGQPRLLMRQSFRDFVPARVLQRRSKAAYGGAFHRALMPMALDMLNGSPDALLVRRGLIDRDSLKSRLRRFSQGLECNACQLRNLVLLEFWMRRFELGKLGFQHAAGKRQIPESVAPFNNAGLHHEDHFRESLVIA